MEIPKPPGLADVLRTPTPSLGERNAAPAPALPLPVDRSSIKLLDLTGALQILIAEVKLALGDAGFGPPDPSLGEALQRWAAAQPPLALLLADPDTAQAALAPPARALLEIVLRALPAEDQPPQAWTAAVQKLTQALANGSAAAIERISAWHDTPVRLAALLEKSRALALDLLGEDAPLPLLTRPEWLGLGAALTRFHRLRRRQRRLLLSDTDADWLDDDADIDESGHTHENASSRPSRRERRP
jgi:hypothetical protein